MRNRNECPCCSWGVRDGAQVSGYSDEWGCTDPEAAHDLRLWSVCGVGVGGGGAVPVLSRPRSPKRHHCGGE